MGCHFLLQGVFPPRDRTRIFCTGGQILSPPPQLGNAFNLSPLFLSSSPSVRAETVLEQLSENNHCNAAFGYHSVQFSRSVVSDPLRPHESQHARPPCPSPTPGVHSDSRPSRQRCHPAISSSVVPFSSCPQSLPASESFPANLFLHMRWPKYWSFSFSIIPSKEIPGLISFRMDWLDLLAV